MSPFTQITQQHSSNTTQSRSGSPIVFVVLVFALSLPFWLLGTIVELQLLPGLPMSSLEVGWSGYLTDPIQDRWGALRAGIVMEVEVQESGLVMHMSSIYTSQ